MKYLEQQNDKKHEKHDKHPCHFLRHVENMECSLIETVVITGMDITGETNF